MTITAKDMETIDVAAVAAATRTAAAQVMDMREEQVVHALATSVWGTVEEMISREFTGSYRGYYPKCGMTLRCEMVFAEVFDLLAAAFDDPRRTVRYGVTALPVASAGGRSDG